MKHEKDKRFARWLVKVLLPGYHLQKDRGEAKKECETTDGKEIKE